MSSKLEKKWWFEAGCLVLAVALSSGLLNAAGVAQPFQSLAGGLVWALCFGGLQRALSFSIWLVVLMVAPRLAVSGEVRREGPGREAA